MCPVYIDVGKYSKIYRVRFCRCPYPGKHYDNRKRSYTVVCSVVSHHISIRFSYLPRSITYDRIRRNTMVLWIRMEGIWGGGGRDYIRRMVVCICSFLYEDNRIRWRKRQHMIIYGRISSYTTRRYTVVNLVSGNTTVKDRLRRRIQ
jgi:hypothetical protein